jgi:adenylate cyclase
MLGLNENTLTRLLNEYLNKMACLAHCYGETEDKFMGHGAMIQYGQSTDIRKDAIACVQMTIVM